MTTTVSMGLVLPVVSETTGPEWASMLNAALDIVDSHDHSTGSGVRVGSAGLNINADLTFSDYSITDLRFLGLYNAGSNTSTSGQIFAYNGELYFKDYASNSVQITSGGTVSSAGSGNITGLDAPAAATFSSVTGTFGITKDSSKPAKNAVADLKIYEYDNASANPVTLKSPASLASSYTWTLPTAAAASAIELVTVDSSGVMDTAVLAGTASQITVTQALSAVTLSLPSTVSTAVLASTTAFRGAAGSVSVPAFSFTADTNTGLYADTADSLTVTAGGTAAVTFRAGQVLGVVGSAAAPSYTFADNDTGMYHVAANEIGFSTNGTLTAGVYTGGLYSIAGSAAAPSYTFSGDVDTGMYRSAANEVTLTAAGSPVASFNSGGMDMTGAINMNGGGDFKVTIFTGTIAANTIGTITASGAIYGYNGNSTFNGTTSWLPIQYDAAKTATTTDSIYTLGGGSTTISLYNYDSNTTNSYRVAVFHA